MFMLGCISVSDWSGFVICLLNACMPIVPHVPHVPHVVVQLYQGNLKRIYIQAQVREEHSKSAR